MLEALANVLWLVMRPCYDLTGNWWIAILLFTLICKIVLMPLSLWCQKNSIIMVTVMPAINRIKVQFYGDNEVIGEKQNALFKEKNYHPLLSLIPLVVQILILFGLVEVIHGVTDNGAPGTEFLGLVPIEDGGMSWVMPILAGLSAVALGFAQNRINPLQKEQTKAEKNMTNGLSIGLSLILGVYVAAGMAFYWICSNLIAILVQALCNICIKPAKYIDYEDLEASRVELEALDNLVEKKKWYQKDPLTKREKEDYARFFNIVNKHLVYYSEGSNYYRYFQGSIEYLLNNSDVTIHYVTNDPDDVIFGLAKDNPRIQPYFIREKRAITLMMKMDADVVVITLEDLDNYYIKRSYMRKDTEYIYMPHHMTGFYMAGWKHAYDHYDTVMCVGPHQVEELAKAEELYNLPRKKNLVAAGYDMLDRSIAAAEAEAAANASIANNIVSEAESDTAATATTTAAATSADALSSNTTPASKKPLICIGPGWQEGNILDTCIDDLIRALVGHGYRIVVRPHPEYAKRFRPRWDALKLRIDAFVAEECTTDGITDEEIIYEDDFSKPSSVNVADVLLTDWSSVAYDFSFAKLKPTLFINTKMKVNNPDWEELGITPSDIWLRDKVGVSFDENRAREIGPTVEDMINNPDAWTERIRTVREEAIFNLGRGGATAGEYILNAVLRKQEEHEREMGGAHHE